MGINDLSLSCRSDTIAILSEINSEQGNSDVIDYVKRNEYEKEVEDNGLDLMSKVEQYRVIIS